MTYFKPVKASLVATALFFVSLATFGAPSDPVPPGPEALARLGAGTGPRREGSPEETRVFGLLAGWFSSRAEVHRTDFRGLDEEHSFSQQLWFRVAGSRPGDLVIVVPTDGSNDRGLAWAVAWARDALDHGTPVSLTFLFTGAERGTGTAAGLGSRTFLQDFYPTGPAAVLYFDADPSDNGLRLTTESGIFPSPLWMVQGLSEAFERQGLEPRFSGSSPSLFRLDLPERKNLLDPWFQRSIPGVWVASGPGGTGMVRALEAFTAALGQGVPARWDRHYLVFDLGSGKVFWDQMTYLEVFLGASAFLLFGYAALGRRRGSLRVLGTALWQIPVLLAVLFLALEASTRGVSWILALRGTPDLWKSAPAMVGLFKLLTTFTLYLLVLLPFRRSPLVRDPDFYGQAALLWFGVLVMVAAAIELSFSFYFLWALVWAAVLVVAPWRPVKLAALVAGPLWMFKAAWDILGPQPDLTLARSVLVTPLGGNVLLAILLFPFLLQVSAWHFAGHRRQERNEGLRAGIQLSLWTLATVASLFLVFRMPVPAARVTAPLVHLDLPSRSRILEPGTRLLPWEAPGWKTTVTRSAFLDRSVWDLEFSGTVVPEELDLTLAGDGPLTVYECTFPVVLDPQGTRARIVIGRQPPLPLDLRITLPSRTRAHLDVTLRGSEGPVPSLEITDRIGLNP
jgi:hypothetical protein